MSAPAANTRSPPVTTTAPGGSSVSAVAAPSELAQQLRGERVDLGVVEAHDGHAVVAALDGDERRSVPGMAGTLRCRSRLPGRPASSSSAAVHGSRRRADAPRPRARRARLRRAGSSARWRSRCGDDLRAARRRGAGPAAVELARRLEVRAVLPRPRRHSSSTPSPVDRDGGDDRRAPRRPRSDRSSICSRSRRVSSTPGRSALLITNTSAISSRPALLACTASPQPGFTTTTVVSAAPATSTSTWPTPTVSTSTHRQPDGVEHPDRLGRGQRQPAEVAAGGHRADEHAGVEGVVLHADPVAEDGAAGERRRRVDGQHRRPRRRRRARIAPTSALGERRLARPRARR